MTFKGLASQRVSSFDMQLKTYNIIDSKSPIFRACAKLDISEVQELLQQGLASQFDRRIYGESPAECVLTSLANPVQFSQQALAGVRALFGL
jgi:type IV secretory pathway protease TraF